MAGALYIWIILAFFLVTVGVIAVLIFIFWLGHKVEKTQTGATHGFLEVPPNAQSRPASSENIEPSNPSESPNSPENP